ncbi:MAG TPA: endonuclease/exonuclease/phosphatase family protein [Thermoanaerobaculia bacterium]|nr:endonuclease/exonuclease/phosphatase family protein [Thermoanaerobaculia bacterium]
MKSASVLRPALPLFLLAVLASACATSRPATQQLRVMTFNIRVDVASDGPNAWPMRKEIVASMIRFHQADLVGLQEALPGQLADLAALLPRFRRVGVGRGADLRDEASAILYRADRFALLDQGTFWLSQTPSVPGSLGWDARYPRIVTWAKLRDLRSGEVLVHFNTHFDYAGEVARRESARLFRSRIDEIAKNDPAIVTGDFNTTPDSEPYRIMTAEPRGLRDALTISECPPHGPTGSWNGFSAIEAGRRIDFVFLSPGFHVLEHAILSDTFDGRFPSDHLPVIAVIGEGNGEAGCR